MGYNEPAGDRTGNLSKELRVADIGCGSVDRRKGCGVSPSEGDGIGYVRSRSDVVAIGTGGTGGIASEDLDLVHRDAGAQCNGLRAGAVGAAEDRRIKGRIVPCGVRQRTLVPIGDTGTPSSTRVGGNTIAVGSDVGSATVPEQVGGAGAT